MSNQPQFHRPYKDYEDDQLVAMVTSVPRDDRLSVRIAWEDKMTHAYAEIGYRLMHKQWVKFEPPRGEEIQDDNHND